jgi:hypothetical protein
MFRLLILWVGLPRVAAPQQGRVKVPYTMTYRCQYLQRVTLIRFYSKKEIYELQYRLGN